MGPLPFGVNQVQFTLSSIGIRRAGTSIGSRRIVILRKSRYVFHPAHTDISFLARQRREEETSMARGGGGGPLQLPAKRTMPSDYFPRRGGN